MISALSLLLLATSCAVAGATPPFPPVDPGPVAPPGEALLDPRDFEVEPEALEWDDLSADVFDTRWILPEPRRAPGRDLLVEMRALLAARFDFEGPDGTRYRCFGDLVAASAPLDPDAKEAWFAGLARSRNLASPAADASGVRSPEAFLGDWRSGVRELLFDHHVHSPRWKPKENHAADGLLPAEGWDLRREERSPWTSIAVKPEMEQAACLLRADLATIKAVENDYRAYPANVGASYEEIGPLPGSYYLGEDGAGRAFSALTIRFRCDLPFPFSDYTTRLGILNRFDGNGVLNTDIYSTSPDFHWLAGRDVFLPVLDGEGEWIAFLLVRHFGFDLDGVPDGPDARRQALRGSMGNLKRNAERRYARRPDGAASPRNDPAILKETRVLGRR